MEYNPKINLVDSDGNTALHHIDSSTFITIAKILVNGCADPNIRNNDQETPICRAAWCPNVEILKYLAKKVELNVLGS